MDSHEADVHYQGYQRRLYIRYLTWRPKIPLAPPCTNTPDRCDKPGTDAFARAESRTPHKNSPSFPIRTLAEVRQRGDVHHFALRCAHCTPVFRRMPGRIPSAVVEHRCDAECSHHAGDINASPAIRFAIAKRESKSIAERQVSDEADDAVAARVVIKSDDLCDHGCSGYGASHDIGRVILIESRPGVGGRVRRRGWRSDIHAQRPPGRQR